MTTGFHKPFTEGHAVYLRNLIKSLLCLDKQINVAIISTVRNLFHTEGYDKYDILPPELRRYKDRVEVFYINHLWLVSLLYKIEKARISFTISELPLLTIRVLKRIAMSASDESILVHVCALSKSLSLIACNVLRVPCILSQLTIPQSHIDILLTRKFKRVICSSYTLHYMLQHVVSSSTYIPPPIDIRLFENIAPASIAYQDRPILLYLGNIIPERFPSQFLKVLKKLSQKIDYIMYIIAPITRVNLVRAMELRRLIAKLQLQSYVKLVLKDLNEVEKIRLLKGASLFVAPFTCNLNTIVIPPLSILEAMAAGVPIIASKTAATWEVIDNNVGRLLRPFSEKTIEEWYKAIETLLRDECLRRELSLNARKKAHFYDGQIIAKLMLNIYEEQLT